MHQIEHGILYEDSYLGVTLGALAFPHGIMVIDAPLRAEDARSWRSALINQRGGPNRLLVNLDEHPDRTLGARALDCTIVAHQETAQVFRNRPTIFKGYSEESGAIWEVYNEAIGMRWAAPDITFTQRMSLHWGGPEIVLEYHPGPTSGSMWVVIPEAQVVFVGDMVVLDQPPFLADADLHAWLEGLDLLLTSYNHYVVVSGRGGPVSVEVIQAQLQFLQDVVDGMEQLAKRNASPEATEDLIPSIFSKIPSTAQWREKYIQRLRHGLYQCYARRYRSVISAEHSAISDEE